MLLARKEVLNFSCSIQGDIFIIQSMRSRTKSLLVLACVVFVMASIESKGQTSDSTSAPAVNLPSQFLGSAPEAKATPEVLQIDFKDAIDRGLRNNLGLLLASDQTETARGERWKALSDLLPNINARIQENAQDESLAALGFSKLLPLLAPPGTNTSSFHIHKKLNITDERTIPFLTPLQTLKLR